jgi:hypothetical protein
LPDATADNNSIYPSAVPQRYRQKSGGSYEEKPAETQTSNGPASSLVRAPYSSLGGHEFESLMWTDSVLTS